MPPKADLLPADLPRRQANTLFLSSASSEEGGQETGCVREALRKGETTGDERNTALVLAQASTSLSSWQWRAAMSSRLS